MRVITSACFGFALAASAFALSSAPASALESPSVTGITPNHVIRVYDDRREERRGHEERERRERAEREAREHRMHCEHARRECGERHGYDRHDFHRCVERKGCGR